jgi:hypothetical protein
VSVFAAGCGGITTKSAQSTTTPRRVDASTTANTPPTGTTMAASQPAITRDEFASIDYGMTLDQVSATFGSPGTVRSSDADGTESRWWDGPPGSDGVAMLVFRDGVVFGKTQTGLP